MKGDSDKNKLSHELVGGEETKKKLWGIKKISRKKVWALVIKKRKKKFGFCCQSGNRGLQKKGGGLMEENHWIEIWEKDLGWSMRKKDLVGLIQEYERTT